MENLSGAQKSSVVAKLTAQQREALEIEKGKIREVISKSVSQTARMREAMTTYGITEENLISTLALRRLGLAEAEIITQDSSARQFPRATKAMEAYNNPEDFVNDLEMRIAIVEIPGMEAAMEAYDVTQESLASALATRRRSAKLEKAGKQEGPQQPSLTKTSLKNRHGTAISSNEEKLGILDSLKLIFEPKRPEIVEIVTKSFGTFRLDTKIFPPELKDVNKELLLQLIAEKIEAGGELYQQIINGDKEKIYQIHLKKIGSTPTTAEEDKLLEQEIKTLENISNLMWFLQAKAENLQEGERAERMGVFSSGSFSMEDPHLFITHYLDMSKEVYQRASSHIKDFQKVDGGVARGIDFNPGYFDSFQPEQYYLKNVLPYDKRTLMVSPMLDSTGLIEKGKNRVLLKMENYGCASPFFKNEPKGPISREFSIFKDLEHLAGHTWEFLLSLWRTFMGSQNAEGTRKERIPSDIKKAFRDLINGFKDANDKSIYHNAKGQTCRLDKVLEAKDGKAFSEIQAFLVDPFSNSGGIRIMYARAKWLLDNPDKVILTNTMRTKLNDFCQKLEKRYSPESLAFRIGDEVIFNQKDLL